MSAFVSPLGPLLASSSSLSGTRLRTCKTQFTRVHSRVSVSPRCVASQKIQEGHDQRIKINDQEILFSYFRGESPTVVFLPGFFYSRWRQAKANALEIFAKRRGQAILVEEYLGTGNSEADFGTQGTLSRWIADSVALIDEVVGADGKVVLVGAGIGGWIMLHVAMQRPNNVVGLVGLNASVDFTHDLILPSMSAEQKDKLESKGVIDMPWGFRTYSIGKALLDDAEKWLILKGGQDSLDINCPVRLIQGLSDEEIPPPRALKLVEALKSDDVVLSLVKYGDHVLEDEEDHKRMWDTICDVCDKYYEYDLTSPASG